MKTVRNITNSEPRLGAGPASPGTDFSGLIWGCVTREVIWCSLAGGKWDPPLSPKAVGSATAGKSAHRQRPGRHFPSASEGKELLWIPILRNRTQTLHLLLWPTALTSFFRLVRAG